MAKYYIYDVDGCGYASSIRITTSPLICYRVFIGTEETVYAANMTASKYVYDIQRSIDISSDREYYTDIDEEDGEEYISYPDFNVDEDFIEFINEPTDDIYHEVDIADYF